jgi:Domain of Unknown Function (DUF1206)
MRVSMRILERLLGGALRVLEAQPFGRVLFAITALGLFAFGIFRCTMAYYRHIDSSASSGWLTSIG